MKSTDYEAIFRLRTQRAKCEIDALSELLETLDGVELEKMSSIAIEKLEVIADAIKSECSAARSAWRCYEPEKKDE